MIARARDVRALESLYRFVRPTPCPRPSRRAFNSREVVLVDVGIAMGPAIASIHEKRAELRDQIQAQSPETELRQRPRRRLRDVLSDTCREGEPPG